MIIKITCKNCHKTYDVTKTEEIPVNAVAMFCNFCVNCETSATAPYHEWVKRERKTKKTQLTFFKKGLKK